MKLSARGSTNYLVKIAVLGAIARVVMFFEFALPIFPSFLKFDFSDLIALIGALVMGPVAGVLIELVKCLLHLLNNTSGGVGTLANFLVGSAFVWAAGFCYQRRKTKGGALIALGVGALTMMLAGALVNYFVVIPLYALVIDLPTEAIVAMSSAVIPAIHDKLTLVLYAFTPFNLIKGLAVSLLALPVYKKLSPLLK